MNQKNEFKPFWFEANLAYGRIDSIEKWGEIIEAHGNIKSVEEFLKNVHATVETEKTEVGAMKKMERYIPKFELHVDHGSLMTLKDWAQRNGMFDILMNVNLPLTWERVLERDDLIGGDIENHENGDVYRGPLESIEIKNGQVFFTSPWTAKLNRETGEWRKWHINSCSINEKSLPGDIGDGRLQFNMPGLGMAVIFPKGGSKLDPKKVKGLEL